MGKLRLMLTIDYRLLPGSVYEFQSILSQKAGRPTGALNSGNPRYQSPIGYIEHTLSMQASSAKVESLCQNTNLLKTDCVPIPVPVHSPEDGTGTQDTQAASYWRLVQRCESYLGMFGECTRWLGVVAVAVMRKAGAGWERETCAGR